MANTKVFSQLPLKKELSSIQTGSIVVAVLMLVMSLIGLLFTNSIYQTQEQIQSYKTNDLINILIGLPALLGSIGLAQRGKWIGLLFWPGALMYVFYNYIAMLIGIPFNWPTLIFAGLVLLSGYLLFDLLRTIDGEAVHNQLKGLVYERFSGGVLVLFGIGFFFLAMNVIQQAGSTQSISRVDVGVSVADMVLSLLLLVGGILFFLRKSLGYASGPGMLFAAMLLFVGVILFVIIQPYLSGTAFNWNDMIALGSMALICSIPFILMTRRILSNE